MMPTNKRPRTSKPRGICRYYTTTRGCFAGSTCKFLHADPERDPDSSKLLSPYDESKRCRYYANGFCRRGDQCWFKHITDDPHRPPSQTGHTDEDAQNEPCSICFEKPVTYGLLSGCSHIFCLTCIRQWRGQKGQIEYGNIKRCPMCREPSKFTTPSSRFWKHGHPEKDRIIRAYQESMARVHCRYFQRSRQKHKARPLCPFGKDCFYKHLNDDGTPHVFKDGVNVCMREYFQVMRPSMRSMFDDFMDFTTEFLPLSVNEMGNRDDTGMFLQITADMDAIDEALTSGERSSGNIALHEDPHIRRQLNILREAMDNLQSAVSISNDSVSRTLDRVRALVERDPNTDMGSSHTMGVAAEPIPDSHPIEDIPGPSHSSGDRTNIQWLSLPQLPSEAQAYEVDFYDMPGLQTVSNSSLSDTYPSGSDSDSDDEVSQLGRYLRSAAGRRFGTTVDPTDSEEREDEETRMMQEIAERGPEETVAEVGLDIDEDEPQIPVMDFEFPTAEDEINQQDGSRVADPPFLTDGRGRVVWSSNGETGELSSSELRPSEGRGRGTEAAGEGEPKCSGTARGISANDNGEEDEHSH